jgi:hypothetical protein
MTNSVIDLIDNVIGQVGADAMRWSPDAPEPEPFAPTQAYIVRRGVLTGSLMVVVDETHRFTQIHLREALDQFFLHGQGFFIEIHPAELARRARLRRMRHLYRMRRRRR